MSVPLRSKTSTIDIYIKLAQYPILAEKIRSIMREMLFSKGIVSESDFEQEVHEKAIESQKREGLYDPFNKEPAGIWQKRKNRIRDFHTDFYFGFNFPTEEFEALVENTLRDVSNRPERVELGFNPELAPWELLFRQGEIFESLPDDDRSRARHHLEEVKVVLIKGMISDHLRFVGVAKKILSIADLRKIFNRRIGEGKIGGKAAGMVLAWRILQETAQLDTQVEIPESYFIGSEVIYEFRRKNGLDYIMNQKYRPLEEIRRDYPNVLAEHLNGEFPEDVVQQLHEVLEMMGTRPLIVRSSSLLEDNFGFSFAGKYDSIFCPNQGTREENLTALLNAIRRTYASTLNPNAILYRQKHGLIDYDERMAVLIQAVQGERFNNFYFPTLAGVGFSQNAYRWNEKIRREDGFLRLVWGMGTRAVDRVSTDYARLISLSHPTLRPETTSSAIRLYSQHYIDAIDLADNTFKTFPVYEVLSKRYLPLQQIASIDRGDYIEPILSRTTLKGDDRLVLTFDRLTKDDTFTHTMRTILQTLEKAYNQPVDIEFTISLSRQGPETEYKIFLLQCRPLSERPEAKPAKIPAHVPKDRLIFRSRRLVPDGTILGIRYIVFIDPRIYRTISDPTVKLELGRVVSRINHALDGESFVLIGPGRWGSNNLDLGVRVTYADIHNTKALIELSVPEGDQAPELSYGTHFFQDLVEAGIFSLPVHLDEDGEFNWSFFAAAPNQLPTLLPEDEPFAQFVQVIDLLQSKNQQLNILMNGVEDKTVALLSGPIGQGSH
ncbi:MAG: PEP/pyruvate-binding domain-containing protein [Ardenticatenaceae bacterium]|nr:PEP/pyruvate-binding domain-containing protein [Ardenticatenaceae bacterium]